MKVTRGELKQIINEEVEAQMIKEGALADIAELIKDSGEDVWDWIKDNAETVADAAASVGETAADFAGDVAEFAYRGVDATTAKIKDVGDFEFGGERHAKTGGWNPTGTKLSYAARQKERDWSADEDDRHQRNLDLKARNDELDAEWEEERAAHERDMARMRRDARDREEARKNSSWYKRQQQEDYILQQQGPGGLARYKADRDQKEKDRRDAERERGKQSWDHSEHGEGLEEIDRNELKKIIAEELKAALGGK